MSLDEKKFTSNLSPQQLIPTFKAIMEGLFWAEYFNSMLKCWEPLIDPVSYNLLYEQVRNFFNLILNFYILNLQFYFSL